MKSTTILFPPESQQLCSFQKPENQIYKSSFCLRLPLDYLVVQISDDLGLFFGRWDNHKRTNSFVPYPPVKPVSTMEKHQLQVHLAGALASSRVFVV